jgi:signal transduction histidine kinase/DNA-binding response OmpR family regulator
MFKSIYKHLSNNIFIDVPLNVKFRFFSYFLLLFVFTVGTITFFFTIHKNGFNALRDNLTIILETTKLRLATTVNSELALVCKMADSPLIQRYFLDPSNPSLETLALEEFDVYRRNFKTKVVFWINDKDKLFYIDKQKPYHVNPSNPENYWYNMTLYKTNLYNFNINYNPDLKVINIWVNAPVFTADINGQKTPIGMLGSTINITDLINNLSKVDNKISLYLFNSNGEITSTKDTSLIFKKVKLTDHLGDVGAQIINIARSLRETETKIFVHNDIMYGVSNIPQLGWYLVNSVPISTSTLFEPSIAIVYCSIFILITLIIVAFNIFISRINTTLEKRNKELELLNHDATAASRAKSDFLARMSHEIRTPMNAIIGLSELASREDDGKNIQEYIMGIKGAGINLLAIINDILDFSKIESGYLSINSDIYYTSSLLIDTLNVIKVKLSESPLELIINISPDIPSKMDGDSTRISQILLNLLTNAVKYTNKGYIKFTVFGEPLDENNIKLTFIVEDSGIGIKNEDLSKLFGQFIRLDEKKNTNIEGTGLGLIIAQSLCRAMDGFITVTSEYGRGSVFTAVLTQTVVDWTPIGEFNLISNIKLEKFDPSFTAPDVKILVVDDFQSNILVIEGLLWPYKIKVFTCKNGLQALELAREHHFDLILMDHMMPVMDGVEATLTIRNWPEDKFQDLPIIALTANAVSGMKEMYLSNGFNDYISKPIDPAKLDTILKRWIPSSKRQYININTNLDNQSELNNNDNQALDIYGVDIQSALTRVGGSIDRYRELLKIFRREVEENSKLLEKEPDNLSLPAFTTLVHGFKSALANIGAVNLSNYAQSLETSARQANFERINQDLPSFRREINALIEQISQRLASTETKNSPTLGDNPEEVLIILKAAIGDNDFETIDSSLEKLYNMSLSNQLRTQVLEIGEFILTAEFQKAVDVINTVIELNRA